MIQLTKEEAQHVLDALEVAPFISNGDDVAYHDKAIQTLRASLAEPEKEQAPVAWMTIFDDAERGSFGKPADTHINLDEAERQVERHARRGLCKLRVMPLYIVPPQREWQGLTDEEIRNEAKNHVFDESFFSGAIWARGKMMGKNYD